MCRPLHSNQPVRLTFSAGLAGGALLAVSPGEGRAIVKDVEVWLEGVDPGLGRAVVAGLCSTFHLSVEDAVSLVREAPVKVKRRATPARALVLRRALEATGARVCVQPCGDPPPGTPRPPTSRPPRPDSEVPHVSVTPHAIPGEETETPWRSLRHAIAGFVGR